MLNLLDTDSRIQDLGSLAGIHQSELVKNRQKVVDICSEMQKKGHAASLNLELISADHLRDGMMWPGHEPAYKAYCYCPGSLLSSET
jgi:hypothetical protein